MRTFAVLSGVFLGAILLAIGYTMAFLHGPYGYYAPLAAAGIATLGLSVAYLLKAVRKLPRGVSRVLFVAMLIALVALWLPLADPDQRVVHMPPMIVFSIIWIIAALPLLRAGIRHRP